MASSSSMEELMKKIKHNKDGLNCAVCQTVLYPYKVPKASDLELVVHREMGNPKDGCGNLVHRGCARLAMENQDDKRCPACNQSSSTPATYWPAVSVGVLNSLAILRDSSVELVSQLEATKRMHAEKQAEKQAGKCTAKRDSPSTGRLPTSRTTADAESSTEVVLRGDAETLTDGICGFQVQRSMLIALFGHAVELVLGIVPPTAGRCRLAGSDLRYLHLLTVLHEFVWENARVVEPAVAGRTLHEFMVQRGWSLQEVHMFSSFLAKLGARPALVASFVLPPEYVRPIHLLPPVNPTAPGYDSVECSQVKRFLDAVIRPFLEQETQNLEVIKEVLLNVGLPHLLPLISFSDQKALGRMYEPKALDSLKAMLMVEKKRHAKIQFRSCLNILSSFVASAVPPRRLSQPLLSPSKQRDEQRFVDELLSESDVLKPALASSPSTSPMHAFEPSAKLDLAVTQDKGLVLHSTSPSKQGRSLPDQPTDPGRNGRSRSSSPAFTPRSVRPRHRYTFHRTPSSSPEFLRYQQRQSPKKAWQFDPFTGQPLRGSAKHSRSITPEYHPEREPSRRRIDVKEERDEHDWDCVRKDLPQPEKSLSSHATVMPHEERQTLIAAVPQGRLQNSRDIGSAQSENIGETSRGRYFDTSRASSDLFKKPSHLKPWSGGKGPFRYCRDIAVRTTKTTEIRGAASGTKSGTAASLHKGTVPSSPATSPHRSPLNSLTPRQKQLLQRVKDSLNTGGFNKVELYPDSRRYVLEARFKVFKDQLRKSPMLDAVDLALLLFGTHNTVLGIFTGQYLGLKAALGSDVVNDITGWINSYHPACLKNPSLQISSEGLLAAFSKKVGYLREKEAGSYAEDPQQEPAFKSPSTSKKRDSPSEDEEDYTQEIL